MAARRPSAVASVARRLAGVLRTPSALAMSHTLQACSHVKVALAGAPRNLAAAAAPALVVTKPPGPAAISAAILSLSRAASMAPRQREAGICGPAKGARSAAITPLSKPERAPTMRASAKSLSVSSFLASCIESGIPTTLCTPLASG